MPDFSDLMKVCEPFACVANLIDSLPEWSDGDLALREFMPGTWPTIADIRKLRDTMERAGWKMK